MARLAGPILVTQLGNMLLGVVDTAVVGRLSEPALGAVGLGSTVFFTVSVLGFGWMLALDPLIAQAVGAQEPERARRWLWQGVWVAVIGTVPLGLLLSGVAESVGSLGVPAEVSVQLGPYLYARLWGLCPFLLLAAMRAFLQAHEVTRPLVIGVVIANIINLPLTWALVFGELGLPRLGSEGAGFASAIATVVQLLVTAYAVRSLWSGRRWYAPAWNLVQRVLRLGSPIGLQLAAEVGSFAIVTVLMGSFGTRALGAHNVALVTISFTFQLAVAIGAAGSVRVGHAVGRQDTESARRAGLTAIAVGAATMLFGSVAFLTVPRQLARVLTDEPGVIEATVPLFMVAACFQLSDGVQSVAAGALRGAGDTRWPLVANLIGHYAVGLPLGGALAFGLGWGPVGLWWGLSAGLTAVAASLALRFWILSLGTIERA